MSGWQAAVARPDRTTLAREDETGRRLVEEHAGRTTEQEVKRWGPAGLAATAEQLGFRLP
ncbi:hypothetical protein [Streptomyces sp. NPDC046870]|uniref:hypothetical protein n=1 Tax=Streptomyces sp. NPDC046870 TaxID=3155135 RepID=UPI003456C7ED